MVDFTKNDTYSYTPMHLLNIMILERIQSVIDGVEAYNRLMMKQGHAESYEVRARVQSLFFLLYGMIKRDEKLDFKKISYLVRSESFDDNMTAYYELAEWLDRKRITRADTKTSYDSSVLETENEVKGL